MPVSLLQIGALWSYAMHIHYSTLKKITHLIQEMVPDGIFGEAFTQEKDQIVLAFTKPDQELYLRIACAAPLPFLWPVRQYHKARKNVKLLFSQLDGLRMTKVETLDFERVILIHLEKGFTLVLKMHGLLSNVLVMKGGKVVDRFRHHHDPDLDFQPKAGDFDVNWESNLAENADASTLNRLRAISFIFEKNCAAFVDRQMMAGKDFPLAVKTLLAALDDDMAYIVKRPNRIQFLPFDPGVAGALCFDSPEVALRVFFKSWFQYQSYARNYELVRKPLAKHLKRYKGQIESFYKSISSIEEARPAEEIGHILMANLHVLKQGMKVAELTDFYLNQPIKIKLKPELNPQQNAEAYYQKQKKNRSRLKHIEQQIERLETEQLIYLEIQEAFTAFAEPETLTLEEKGIDYAQSKALQAFCKEHLKLLASSKPRLAGRKHPFLEFKFQGYTILVGKNAKQNDLLTFKFSRKMDIWMHARDTRGSHVIVRNPGMQDLPTQVLEYAASLAAFNSKDKSKGLVPVQYTERKFVRKVRNGHPGQVIVEREKVILIEPFAGKTVG